MLHAIAAPYGAAAVVGERMDDTPEDRRDWALGADTVAAMVEAAERGDRAACVTLAEPLHPADLADLLEQIGPTERERVLAALGPELDGDVLSELDEGLREEVIATLDAEALAGAVKDLESDDVVDLIEDLDEPQQEAILDALDRQDRYAVERALAYPEESAGRLMQREVAAVPEHFTVGQAIDWLRDHDDLPEQFYHMVLVDPRWRPTGYVTLGRILGSRRETRLRDIAEESFRAIPATQDEEEVAYAFNQYHLISAPVVGEDGRLVGVITIDDAMAVLSQENEEDLLRLAGVGDESLSDRTMQIARQRFPWLAVNLVTAILASVVISLFEDVIAAVVALAVLMPIVASMGGNAGTQSLTVRVGRGLGYALSRTIRALRCSCGSFTRFIALPRVAAWYCSGVQFITPAASSAPLPNPGRGDASGSVAGSARRFQGQTSWQTSQPNSQSPIPACISGGTPPRCSIVQYEMHLRGSNSYGVIASVGQASTHRVQVPHRSTAGASGASVAVVTTSPSSR